MQPETLITITTEIHQLSALLNDCVSSGASVGLLAPLESGEAEDYWQAVGGECQQGHRQLLLTREEGKITGAVQISYCTRINGRHRAEVEKLMVHSAYRQRGIGWLLIAEVENQAAARQRTLLVLDTRSNDIASLLYVKAGWQQAEQVSVHWQRIQRVISCYVRSSRFSVTGCIWRS